MSLAILAFVACGEGSAPRDAGLDARLAPATRDAGPSSCDALTHTGCVGLCCEGGCVPISLVECTACGVGCEPGTADACLGRSCRCGQGPACRGATPFCEGGECVECRAHADCTSTSCIEGRCQALGPTLTRVSEG